MTVLSNMFFMSFLAFILQKSIIKVEFCFILYAKDKGGVNMQSNRKGKISHTLQPISIIPLIFLGILILILGTNFFTKAMHDEVELELKYVASNTITLLDTAYPGDYELRGDTYYSLYKGGTDITNDYSLIDKIKEDTGLDITLFYENTRFQTTIIGPDGNRIVGSVAAETILNDVLRTGQARFYNNALVDTVTYFSYYVPLTNSDGRVVGMLFVGKPRAEVDQAVQKTLYPLMIAVFATIIIMSVCISLYTKSLVKVLVKIRNYVTAVSAGNLDAELSNRVLERNDELGEIALSIQTMHRSLRTMVEQDALTGLYNRRCANRKLEQALQKSAQKGTPLCLALCDIDFFKKINDTYGHDCGDVVLKQVARTLNEHLRKHGFVARWGGEEFLILFEYSTLEEATQILEKTREAISQLEIPYENQIVKLTMSMGITGNDGSGLDNLLRIADKMLYEGKAAGRNRVVVHKAENTAQNDTE